MAASGVRERYQSGGRRDHRRQAASRRTLLLVCDGDGDGRADRLGERLRLPRGDSARRWAGGCGGRRSATTGLQSDGKTLDLPEVRIDVNIILRVRGRTGIKLRRSLVQQVATGVNGKVRIRSGALIALYLRRGRGYIIILTLVSGRTHEITRRDVLFSYLLRCSRTPSNL